MHLTCGGTSGNIYNEDGVLRLLATWSPAKAFYLEFGIARTGRTTSNTKTVGAVVAGIFFAVALDFGSGPFAFKSREHSTSTHASQGATSH